MRVSKTEVSFSFPKNFFETTQTGDVNQNQAGQEPKYGPYGLTRRQMQIAGLLFEYECYFAIIKKGFKGSSNINQADYESKKSTLPILYPKILEDAESLANTMVTQAKANLDCVDTVIFNGGSYGARGTGRQDTADVRFVCSSSSEETPGGVGFSVKYKTGQDSQNTNLQLANMTVSSLLKILGEDESQFLEKRKLLAAKIKKDKEEKASGITYDSDQDVLEGWRLLVSQGNQYSYVKKALEQIGKSIKDITLADLQILKQNSLDSGQSLPVVRQKISSLKSLLKFAQEKEYANFSGTGIFFKEKKIRPELVFGNTETRNSNNDNFESVFNNKILKEQVAEENIYLDIKKDIRSIILKKIKDPQSFANFLNIMLTGGGNTSVFIAGAKEKSISQELKKDFDISREGLKPKDNYSIRTGCEEEMKSNPVNRWRSDFFGCRNPGNFYINYKNTYIFFSIYPKSWSVLISLKIT